MTTSGENDNADLLREIKYLKIKDYHNVSIIEISDAQEFVELIKILKPGFILIMHNRNYRAAFCVIYNGVMYSILAYGYDTVLDLLDGLQKGFPNGEIYYKAIKEGFQNYDEYVTCKQLGYNSRSDFLEGEKLGFRCTVDKFKMFGDITLPFIREGDIYYLAKKLGYKDYDEFQKGLSSGFSNAEEYRKAISQGFKNGIEYKDAIANGFNVFGDYARAKALGICNKMSYDNYTSIEAVKNTYRLKTFGEAHLFKVLVKLKDGEILSASKIWERLNSEVERDFRPKVTNNYINPHVLPFYDGLFKSEQELKEYLAKNRDKTKEIGRYDASGEVFERIVFTDRHICIDGSNAAWGEKNRGVSGAKPTLENIKRMVVALIKEGYKPRNIVVVFDKSYEDLKNSREGKSVINWLRNKGCKEHWAPNKNDADQYMIDYVRKQKAFIVTNDNLRDWKKLDQWVMANIDKYIINYMFINNIVTFDIKYRRKE